MIYQDNRISDNVSALQYQDKDMSISVGYVRFPEINRIMAVDRFWKEYERININLNIQNDERR